MICSIAIIVFWFYVVTSTMKKAMTRLKYDQILIVNFYRSQKLAQTTKMIVLRGDWTPTGLSMAFVERFTLDVQSN
jgi:hypothetical protein